MDSASHCVARGVQHLGKHLLFLHPDYASSLGLFSRDSVGANVTHRTLVSHWGVDNIRQTENTNGAPGSDGVNQPSGSQSGTQMSTICFPSKGEKHLRATAEANEGNGKRSGWRTVLLSRGLRVSDNGEGEGVKLSLIVGSCRLNPHQEEP